MKDQIIFRNPQGQKNILYEYEKYLSKLPDGFEQTYVKTCLGHTFCIVCGDRNLPPLVLLHGSSANTAVWANEFAEYSRHFRVYAIDIPGEPGKSEPKRPSLDGTAYSDWLIDILKHFDIQPGSISIAGMSFGGWMALKFATAYPEYVRHLVLICPAGVTPLRVSFGLRCIHLALQGDRGIGKIISMLYNPQPVDAETREISMLVMKNFNPRRYVPVHSDEMLKELCMPVLFLAGDKDVMFLTKKSSNRLRKLVPNLKIKIIEGASHMLNNTYSEVIPFIENT